jgi:mRNA interferase MazF
VRELARHIARHLPLESLPRVSALLAEGCEEVERFLALSTVIVAPTSTQALPTSFRPQVKVRGRRTRVLVEQVRAVDPERLGRPAGRLAAADLRAIDHALGVVLGLV